MDIGILVAGELAALDDLLAVEEDSVHDDGDRSAERHAIAEGKESSEEQGRVRLVCVTTSRVRSGVRMRLTLYAFPVLSKSGCWRSGGNPSTTCRVYPTPKPASKKKMMTPIVVLTMAKNGGKAEGYQPRQSSGSNQR